MSALELFRFLGEDLNRPPSPPKDILKRRKVSQGQPTTRYWPGKVLLHLPYDTDACM